jgi:hypothetical protein
MKDADEEALVRAAQTHAKAAHGMELTREQALAMAKPELEERKPTK